MDRLKLQKIGEILFFAGIIIELLVMITDHSPITIPFRGRLTHLAFISFGCNILANTINGCYSKKQWIFIILAGLLGVISYITCKDEYVVRIVVMLVASRSVDYKKMVRIILYASVAGTVVIALLSLTGVLGVAVDVRDYGRGVVEKRWNLGFSHANNVHDMLWYITALLLIVFYDKVKWFSYSILMVVNLITMLLTRSRTGFATVVLLLVLGFVDTYLKKYTEKIWLYLLGIITLVACEIITIWSSAVSSLYFEPPRLLNLLNRLLTQRMEMNYEHAYIKEWQLFPGERSIVAVDDGFASIFYQYGIIVGLALTVFLVYMLYLIYKRKNATLLAVYITGIMIIFMESTFAANTSLLCNLLFVVFMCVWNIKDESVQS